MEDLEHKEKIDQVLLLTNCSEDEAVLTLHQYGMDVQAAVNEILESGGRNNQTKVSTNNRKSNKKASNNLINESAYTNSNLTKNYPVKTNSAEKYSSKIESDLSILNAAPKSADETPTGSASSFQQKNKKSLNKKREPNRQSKNFPSDRQFNSRPSSFSAPPLNQASNRSLPRHSNHASYKPDNNHPPVDSDFDSEWTGHTLVLTNSQSTANDLDQLVSADSSHLSALLQIAGISSGPLAELSLAGEQEEVAGQSATEEEQQQPASRPASQSLYLQDPEALRREIFRAVQHSRPLAPTSSRVPSRPVEALRAKLDLGSGFRFGDEDLDSFKPDPQAALNGGLQEPAPQTLEVHSDCSGPLFDAAHPPPALSDSESAYSQSDAGKLNSPPVYQQPVVSPVQQQQQPINHHGMEAAQFYYSKDPVSAVTSSFHNAVVPPPPSQLPPTVNPQPVESGSNAAAAATAALLAANFSRQQQQQQQQRLNQHSGLQYTAGNGGEHLMGMMNSPTALHTLLSMITSNPHLYNMLQNQIAQFVPTSQVANQMRPVVIDQQQDGHQQQQTSQGLPPLTQQQQQQQQPPPQAYHNLQAAQSGANLSTYNQEGFLQRSNQVGAMQNAIFHTNSAPYFVPNAMNMLHSSDDQMANRIYSATGHISASEAAAVNAASKSSVESHIIEHANYANLGKSLSVAQSANQAHNNNFDSLSVAAGYSHRPYFPTGSTYVPTGPMSNQGAHPNFSQKMSVPSQQNLQNQYNKMNSYMSGRGKETTDHYWSSGNLPHINSIQESSAAR